MDTVSVGQFVRAHGDLVEVEEIYDDGDVRVKRVEGEFAGRMALCKISKLEPAEKDLHRRHSGINCV
jgi:hypothetical protein